MTDDDHLKLYRNVEQEAVSGPSYTNHCEIDIREIWTARKLGLPDPAWKPVRNPRKARKVPES